MSHEFETGFFVGEQAWHRIGLVLESAPSTPERALRECAMDVTYGYAPMAVCDLRTGALRASHDRRAVVIDAPQYPWKHGRCVGSVGMDHHMLQPAQVAAFFGPWVESGAVSFESGGSLRDGARMWMLGKVADLKTEIVPGDALESFILVATSFDGSLALSAGFTSVRVVCANTLSVALNGGGRILKARHTASVAQAAEGIRDTIDVQRRTFEATAEQLRRLAAVGCDDATLKRYVREVFAPDAAREDESSAARIVAQVVPLFEAGRGTDVAGVRGTLWGAYNSVTEFLTHVRGRDASSRRDSLWFGEGAKLTSRALTVASAYAAA